MHKSVKQNALNMQQDGCRCDRSTYCNS